MKMPTRSKTDAFALCAALAVVTAAVAFAQAQEVSTESAKPTRIGVKECAACHSAPSPFYQELKVTEFVSLTEAEQWRQHDLHAKAFQLIDPTRSELASHMLEKLGLTVESTEFRNSCLTCHAGIESKPSVANPSEYLFGVQCEACHGNASEWSRFDRHQQSSWRRIKPEDKSKLGLVDLHDPKTRAEQCFGCHIGDIASSRFVTHAMYAAGHPPLTAIEVTTYLNSMPKHWRKLSEKGDFEFRKEYEAANGNAVDALEGNPVRVSTTREILIGNAVASRSLLQLQLDGMQSDQTVNDFALYECSACHHELRVPSVRQVARQGMRPGRPRPISWAIPLGLMGSDDALYRKRLDAMNGLFDKKPFGDRASLIAEESPVRQMIDLLDQHIERVKSSEIGSQLCESILQHIEQLNSNELLDFQTARQVGWVLSRLDEQVGDSRVGEDERASLRKELSDRLALDLAASEPHSVIPRSKSILLKSELYEPGDTRELLVKWVSLIRATLVHDSTGR